MQNIEKILLNLLIITKFKLLIQNYTEIKLMKKTILTLSICACFLAITSTNVFSQTRSTAGVATSNFTIGVVDVDAVVKEIPEAIAGERELMEMSRRFQDTINDMRKDLDARVQNYLKQKAMMTPDNQQQQEEKLQRESLELQNYASEKDNEITTTREKLLEPIRIKVRNAIESVAKDEKISVVLHKNVSVTLYSDPKIDITFRVIDRIKRDK